MTRKYELWLDESGQFTDDKAKQEKENPSLIGGILLEKEMADTLDLTELIPEERKHATELSCNDKKTYLIPTLKKVKEDYHAKLFYIENPNYEYEKTNRQLYLRMMAEGLLQLMQALNAQTESVELEVRIAQRQDFQAQEEKKKIREDEYVYSLEKCIQRKKKQNHILLHKNSKLTFQLGSAYHDPRLELADYASYTRFRRKNKIFCGQKNELNQLFEDAYLFTVTEVGTISYINCLLSDNMVADAIFEVFTTLDRIDIRKELQKICERMKGAGYRLVKAQLKQFTADIIAYAANEDDYEIGERLLKQINNELIVKLKENQLPHEYCQFHILIQLTDMYLREGDIIQARKALNLCKEIQRGLGNSLEETFTYYQLIEKEAVLLVNEFRYKEAYELMEKACNVFQAIMDCIVDRPEMQERFPDIRSEYFGDALCMKIYAGMFMQRAVPEMYEKLCLDSNLALRQYPDHEGELERHRQYRSHIELEAGHYKSALLWLMRAKVYHASSVELADIQDFLYEIYTTEYTISGQYYLMYYLLIMVEAKMTGNGLADIMYQALNEQQDLLEKTGILQSDKPDQKKEIVNIRDATPPATGINYHPLEIDQWKLASYLYHDQKYEEAMGYFSSAVTLCSRYSNYTTMRITGLGIQAEQICCCIDSGQMKDAQAKYQSLLSQIDKLLGEDIPEKSKEFLRSLNQIALHGKEDGKLNKGSLFELSRKISY